MTGPGHRAVAEVFGTFALVFMTVGPSSLGGFDPATSEGRIAIALSSGFAIAAMVYMIGPVSGGHINPAVTLGSFCAGRFSRKHLIPQLVAQCTGAILASGLVAFVALGAGYDIDLHHLGATGWNWPGETHPWSWTSAFAVEVTGTFIYVTLFLTVRHERNPTKIDGLAIGLTAAGLHFATDAVSGGSLNPARSLGSALFAGPAALTQLWLYICAPCLGAMLAGLFSAAMPLQKRDE